MGNNPTLYGYVGNPNWLVDVFGLTGRTGSSARMLEFLFDNNQPSHVRGWIQQEINRGTGYIRKPPGYQLAHWRGYEAAKGYDYSYSDLNTTENHRLQHRYDDHGRANKEGASQKDNSLCRG